MPSSHHDHHRTDASRLMPLQHGTCSRFGTPGSRLLAAAVVIVAGENFADDHRRQLHD